MGNASSRGIRVAAIIAVIIAAAIVCTAAGTLAAFSATYTWSSDTTSGNFPFADTDYTLALFDGATSIMPGDGGSAVLDGPSFDGYNVAWTFSETNDATLPVVFYLRDSAGKIIDGSAYSKYDFSALNGTYVASENGIDRLPVISVSGDPVAFTAALTVGATVCWVWPDAFYTDVTGDALSDDAEVAAYLEECKQLCTAYAFDAALPSVIGEFALSFVTGTEGETLTWQGGTNNSGFTIRDGVVYVGDTEAALYSAGAFHAAADIAGAGLPSDAEVWIMVGTSHAEEISSAALQAGVENLVVNAGTYSIDGNSATPAADGNRTLFRVKVSTVSDGGYPLSVRITATVSAGE